MSRQDWLVFAKVVVFLAVMFLATLYLLEYNGSLRKAPTAIWKKPKRRQLITLCSVGFHNRGRDFARSYSQLKLTHYRRFGRILVARSLHPGRFYRLRQAAAHGTQSKGGHFQFRFDGEIGSFAGEFGPAIQF